MHIRLLIILISLIFFTKEAWSQCLEISSVFVNACTEGTGSTNCTQEGPNEMFTFTVGSSDLFVGNVSVNWPNNTFQGFCNNTVTALKTDTLNNTITSSCGILLEPLTDTLPAGTTGTYKPLYILDSCLLLFFYPTLAHTWRTQGPAYPGQSLGAGGSEC